MIGNFKISKYRSILSLHDNQSFIIFMIQKIIIQFKIQLFLIKNKPIGYYYNSNDYINYDV